MDLLDRTAAAIAGPCSADLGRGILVALSGGPDSTALLDLLVRVAGGAESVLAAHLDHGLRPDSRADADAVAASARRLGVRLISRRVEIATLPSRRVAGVEGAAREARYRFLHEAARDAGVPFVATGHHRDDQAETVLLRVVRGTGPRGLRAILPRRPIADGSAVTLIRPLLEVSRAEIVAYLRRRGLSWIEDPTNEDGTNLRSLVRVNVLPELTRRIPGLPERLAAVADRARGLPFGPPAPPVPTSPDPAPPPFDPIPLPCPGSMRLPRRPPPLYERRSSTDLERGRVEVVDAECAPPPYEVRGAREGDRFQPLGLGEETTVYRFLMNCGVPRRERASTPVVVAGSRVVCVLGHRIDERVKVSRATRNRVVLEVDGTR